MKKSTARPKRRRRRVAHPAPLQKSSRAPRKGSRRGRSGPGDARRLSRFLRLSAALLLVALVSGSIFYASIDREVERRLASRTAERVPAVYSDALRIGARPWGPEALRAELLERRYREVSTPPAAAGEFHLAGSEVTVFTREFHLPWGGVAPAQRIHLELHSGELRGSGGTKLSEFYLEPQVISHLGDTEVKAATFQPLTEIPLIARRAVLAIEDERFYEHNGIDLAGIARAMWVNLRALAFVQGGSTITQQFAKNFLFTRARTISRKVREFAAAISLERRLTKDQILELYLNEVYLGQEGSVAIHGFPQAAVTFFGKRVQDLSLPEAALLAGIIRGPSYYAPRRHLKRATDRRNTVLSRMEELGFITAAERAAAQSTPLNVIRESHHRQIAPHFIAAVRREVTEALGDDESALAGLTVYTGLDLTLQQCAERAAATGVTTLEKQNPRVVRRDHPLEVALVALEPFSGKVRAMVGGRDFSRNQFNHATQALRQIGSTIKPFLYLTALDAGRNDYKVATASSILEDRPLAVDGVARGRWEPENYDREFRGDVTLRYALEHSLNLPAVYVGQRVGPAAVATTARAFRLAERIDAVPALALGAADTTLLRLTTAYGALANGGIYTAPRLFTAATDREDTVVVAAPVTEERVSDENSVYVLTNILQGVIERGTGGAVRRAGFTGEAAGKTGTSNDTRDAWFIGFTPDLAVGVWLGYDDNKPVGLTGGRAAAPIWGDFMKCLDPVRVPLPFIPPRGVEFIEVDRETGERVASGCPGEQIVTEVYVRGTEPRRRCRLHGGEYDDELPAPAGTEPPPRRRRDSFWERIFG